VAGDVEVEMHKPPDSKRSEGVSAGSSEKKKDETKGRLCLTGAAKQPARKERHLGSGFILRHDQSL
jgi:hypothetical protein